MGERTRYEHGIPSWVDLGTTDIEGAKAFYAEILGWTHEDLPTDMGVAYTQFSADGKVVAGGGPQPPEVAAMGIPPLWNTYVDVASVDDSVAAAVAAGGSVAMPAMDVMTAGRMAFIMDPTGAAIGLWQAGAHAGAALVNAAGALTWNELVTDDPDTAAEFYTALFGWSSQTDTLPNGMTYTMFKAGDWAAAGMMLKTEQMGPIPNSWGVYFGTGDCDACAAATTAAGGRVLLAPFDTSAGRIAVLQDPQGAVFSVIQSDQMDP